MPPDELPQLRRCQSGRSAGSEPGPVDPPIGDLQKMLLVETSHDDRPNVETCALQLAREVLVSRDHERCTVAGGLMKEASSPPAWQSLRLIEQQGRAMIATDPETRERGNRLIFAEIDIRRREDSSLNRAEARGFATSGITEELKDGARLHQMGEPLRFVRQHDQIGDVFGPRFSKRVPAEVQPRPR